MTPASPIATPRAPRLAPDLLAAAADPAAANPFLAVLAAAIATQPTTAAVAAAPAPAVVTGKPLDGATAGRTVAQPPATLDGTAPLSPTSGPDAARPEAAVPPLPLEGAGLIDGSAPAATQGAQRRPEPNAGPGRSITVSEPPALPVPEPSPPSLREPGDAAERPVVVGGGDAPFTPPTAASAGTAGEGDRPEALVSAEGAGSPVRAGDAAGSSVALMPVSAASATSASASAAPDPAAPPAPPALPRETAPALAASIVSGIAQDRDRLTLQLEPVDLGRVEVALHVDGAGRLHAAFAVERPETLQMLQRDARVLEQALAGDGLQLADAGLSFSLRRDGADGGGQGGGPPDPSRQRPGEPGGRSASAAASGEGPPSPLRRGVIRLLDLSI